MAGEFAVGLQSAGMGGWVREGEGTMGLEQSYLAEERAGSLRPYEMSAVGARGWGEMMWVQNAGGLKTPEVGLRTKPRGSGWGWGGASGGQKAGGSSPGRANLPMARRGDIMVVTDFGGTWLARSGQVAGRWEGGLDAGI